MAPIFGNLKKKILGALLAVAICELAGGIGAIFTTPNIAIWYAGLVKGPLNPPAFVFGPVWTLLFALMGVSAFLVWEKGDKKPSVRTALWIFVLQLLLNIYWSILFFGAHDPAAAFAEILILWFAILWTMVAFRKISHSSFWLLAPYILWVSFAAYLNYSIILLNK
jgi:tryptophan-rich sensory protein